MSDLLMESEDALKQERLMAFWKENGGFIIGMILLTIFLTGAMSFYRSWDTNVKETQTAAIIQMAEATDFPANVTEALNANALKYRKDLKGLLLLRAASTYRSQGDADNAKQTLSYMLEDKNVAADQRDLAIILLAQLDENMKEPLKRLSADDKNAWQALAIFEYARALAKTEQYGEAITQLERIENIKIAPDTLIMRAQDLRGLYQIRMNQTD